MSSQISRSEALVSVPPRKVIEALEQTIRNCSECSEKQNVRIDEGVCKSCYVVNKAIKRFAEANIPVRYWNLSMEKDFRGDTVLLNKYKEIRDNIDKFYKDGTGLCFAGSHGLGKTLVSCNILKYAVVKNYSALYTNLYDVVSVLMSRDVEDRATARKELLMVDFLVIDEFDPRYMNSDKSSDLYGKMLEEIFRTRHQNNLPTIMCTNSPNVVESFTGSIRDSISSLMGCVKMIAVLGEDFRKKGS